MSMFGLLHVVGIVSFIGALTARNGFEDTRIGVDDEDMFKSMLRYRKMMEERIGLCIEPENPKVLQDNESSWAELVWSKMEKNSPLRADAWGNNPWGKSWLSPHMMIGLVHNKIKYPVEPPEDFEKNHNSGLDSECFLTDYSSEGGPDPAGCRIFSKSFAPLKKLRTCIIDHIDRDPIWSTREAAHIVDAKSNFTGKYREWCSQAIWSYLAGGSVPVQLCGRYDSIRRAEEMIKFVLFKKMPHDPDETAKKVRSKIQFTVTWPKGQNSLTEDTAIAIQEQCFGVREGQSLTQVNFLQRINTCLPLMFDKAEIQGFGINDGIMKFQNEDYYGNKIQDLKQRTLFPVTPLCGRLALATIPGFQSAKYTIATWESFQNDQKPTYNECLNVQATNCRKAYYCWESALNRVCGISPHCCNQDNGFEKAVETHNACKTNPDGKLINLGLNTRILPESVFGYWKQKCPKDMGTQLI